MPELDFITIFINRLNRAGLQYMITGSVACAIYGEPRFTNDIDLVLEVSSKSVEKIPEMFGLDEFYCPPLESLIIEAQRSMRGHFNLIHHETGLRADIYTVGQDPLHHWGMAHRKSFGIQGELVWVAPPEYVVLRKLEFFREGGSDKHLKDIAGILELCSDDLNTDWLQENIQARALTGEWGTALKMAKS